ncbi:MAG TPA: ABC transporter ATP-binding protein [Longimicrobium sp.]|nr:ABC transporter ATP-binding protein [Longimicrobium sp.]
MHERWRALVLLVGTAWRTDPRRSAGLLLEPISYLRVPLFALFLGMVADGAVRGDTRTLAIGVGGLALSRVLWFVGMWVGSWNRLELSEKVGFALDCQIATLSSGIPGVEHHERPDYQDRLELLRQEQGLLGGALNTLIVTANTVVASIGTLAVLAWANPWLLLLVPFALPAFPSAAIQQRIFAKAEEASAAPFRRARHLRRLTVDRNAGMELRLFGLTAEIPARFRKAWNEAWAHMNHAEGRGVVIDTVCDLVYLTGFAGAVAFMLWRAVRGQATVGEVVIAFYLGQEVRASVVDPIRRVSSLGSLLRAAGRLIWLRDYAEAETAARPGRGPAPARLREGITFENVSFRYPGTDRWALRDVSFHVPAGGVIALVGENGAGKTTLVKLLARMYEPTEGRILVDGADLASIGVDAWRERLSAAFQDFARFELPARQSVGVGDLPRVDDSRAMEAALDRAGAADVMAALPAGGDTQLGARWENGVDLSTGQWQKLALGRALMRTEPLLAFFDEPTASLDALAEYALFERYAREARQGSARGAVTVLVSHRFSTVRSANLILVIEGGRVSELGAHDELILREGLYSELYLLQARAYQQAAVPALEAA